MEDQLVKTVPESTTETSQEFRSQVGHISRHSGVFFAGTIFTAGLGYLFKVYLARVLGVEALGIYALGFTFIGFLGAFNSLGLVESAVRFAAVYKAADKREQLRSLLWRGGSVLVLANILFAGVFLKIGGPVARHFYHSLLLADYIPWFAALLLIGVVSTFYGRILAGYSAVGRRTIITNFVGSPAITLLAMGFIGAGWGLRGYLLGQVVGSILIAILLLATVWGMTPKNARYVVPWPPPLPREVWSFSASAMGVIFLEFVMAQVDKITLGFYLGPKSVGVYSVAWAMVAYEALILNSVNQVFSPIIADLHTRKQFPMLKRLYRSLTKWVLGLTLPLGIVMIVDARPLMSIFGAAFERGWPLLIIGTVGQLVNCGVGSVGLLLLMSGNQNRLLKVQAVMAGVMIVASIGLIPLWGIIGAAVAAAITNVGMNAWNLLSVRKILGLVPFSPGFFRLLPPSLVSGVLALLVKHYAYVIGHNWMLVGTTLIVAYAAFVVSTLITGLDADDRLITGAIWSKLSGSVAKG